MKEGERRIGFGLWGELFLVEVVTKDVVAILVVGHSDYNRLHRILRGGDVFDVLQLEVVGERRVALRCCRQVQGRPVVGKDTQDVRVEVGCGNREDGCIDGGADPIDICRHICIQQDGYALSCVDLDKTCLV